MKYILDKDKKYYDELLFHLRKHNKSHTGIKEKSIKYIYIVEDTSFKGAIKIQFSWDWIGIKDITYDNIETLQKLINVVIDQYKDKASGFRCMTNDTNRFKEYEQVGFKYYGSSYKTKSYVEHQFGEITEFTSYDDYTNVIIQDEEHETYQPLFQEQVDIYKSNHIEDDIVEEQLHVCVDGETFCGGIYLQIYSEHLYIDLLAVNKEYRGKQIGTKLMDIAEKEARTRNLEWISVGTTQFQARPFYEKQGYKVILTSQDFPKGFECYTLVKELNEE